MSWFNSVSDMLEIKKFTESDVFGVFNLKMMTKLWKGNNLVILARHTLKPDEKKVVKLTGKDFDSHLRFTQEVETVRRLDHPNIAKLEAAVSFPLYNATVMEYYPNGTLRDKILGGKMSQDDIKSHVVEIAAAVRHLHRSRILHRDIKPSNILIHSSNHAVLSDFDLSTIQPRKKKSVTGVRGSRGYIAPEAVDMKGVYDGFKMDCYALGVTIWCMLYGKVVDAPENYLRAVVTTDWTGEFKFYKKLLFNLLHRNPSRRWNMSMTACEMRVSQLLRDRAMAAMFEDRLRSESIT